MFRLDNYRRTSHTKFDIKLHFVWIWARGFFVASSGNVTDEIVREYIEKQEIPKPDDNFKVDNEN